MMYDDEGNQVYEPEGARRFFATPENLLVSITDTGDNSGIRLYIGSSTDVADVLGLDQTLRSTATKYNMLFNLKRQGRDLQPSDFATHASVTESQGDIKMDLLEGMYGTTKSSYLKLENAKMIVRHSRKIDENIAGSRGRHVDAIFVENAQGERMLFPTRQLSPARAMTQHVNQGGSWADQIGQQIGRMATDYSALAQGSSYIGSNAMSLSESAQGMREKIRESMRDMRKCFERLSRSSGYGSERAKLEERANMINEGGDDEEVLVTNDEIKESLFVEGVELDENIVSAIAEALRSKKLGGDEISEEEGDDDVKANDDEIEEGAKEVIPEMITVCGRPVGRDVWNRFKQGTLELIKPVSSEGNPRFGNPRAELAFKLSQVVPCVKDDTMLNLLSHVAEGVNDDATPPDMLQGMVRVAQHAINLSTPKMAAEGFSTKSEVVREFAQWINDFSTARILSENVISEMEDDEDHRDAVHDVDSEIQYVLSNFDPATFLTNAASDLNWYPGQDTGYDEDRTFDRDYVQNEVAGYLNREIESAIGKEVDMSSWAPELTDKVIAVMRAANYTINEGDLNRDDAVIPDNQGEDFENEVTSRDTDSADIARLRTLAGR